MVRQCFVPGCKSGNAITLKKNKENGVRNPSLFKARTVTELEKWKDIIGRKDKEMTLNDNVCELHFEKKYILRYHTHKLKDGSLFKLVRGVPRLSPDAEPTRMTSGTEYTFSIASSNKGYTNSSKRIMKHIATPVHPQSNKVHLINHSTVSECNKDYIEFNFSYLTNNVQKISVPSASWGISFICEYSSTKYVMCAKWNSYIPERRLVIDDNLNAKIFLKGNEICSTLNEIKCMDDVCDLLKRVDRYVLCSGIDDKRMVNCNLYVDRPSSSFGRPKIWCRECVTFRRNKMHQLKKSQQNYRVCSVQYQHLLSSKQRNFCLQKKGIVKTDKQGVGVKNSLKEIESVLEEFQTYEAHVEEFNGTTNDKQYGYLDEMLTKCMLKLDDVDTVGDENVRYYRKNSVKKIQACMDLLKSNAYAINRVINNLVSENEIITSEIQVQPKDKSKIIREVFMSQDATIHSEVEIRGPSPEIPSEVPEVEIKEASTQGLNSNINEVEMFDSPNS